MLKNLLFLIIFLSPLSANSAVMTFTGILSDDEALDQGVTTFYEDGIYAHARYMAGLGDNFFLSGDDLEPGNFIRFCTRKSFTPVSVELNQLARSPAEQIVSIYNPATERHYQMVVRLKGQDNVLIRAYRKRQIVVERKIAADELHTPYYFGEAFAHIDALEFTYLFPENPTVFDNLEMKFPDFENIFVDYCHGCERITLDNMEMIIDE